MLANMREPDERLGDLRAQLAAHRLAERRLEELCERHGREADAPGDGRAPRLLGAARPRGDRAHPDGRYEADDVLETSDGELEIRAAVTVAGELIEIDFAGTSPQQSGNLNCPLAVTRSACYFVVRCLTDPDVPASGGAFAPVSVRAPEGSLVDARPPAAVVAGNVETSSRIVDVLFRAFGQAIPVPAQGQGTMNNLTLGQRPLHVLRDDRRRPGRLSSGERPVGRSRDDVEHASTRRSRRSSSRIRCGSSGTGSGSAQAGVGDTGVGTASSAR